MEKPLPASEIISPPVPREHWSQIDLTGPSIDQRDLDYLLERWRQKLERIRELYLERYPDHPFPDGSEVRLD